MDAKAEKLARFRYGLIAPLVLEALPHGELTRRAQEIASRPYEIPGSTRTAVSVDTLLAWAGRDRRGGFAALAPKARQDRGRSRALTPQLADLIERLKRENPHRSGATLLRELALSAGPPAPAVSASTLYRFLQQRGLTARQLLAPPPAATPRRKVDPAEVRQAVADLGGQARYTELRQHLMRRAACSKRTAQLAITAACEHGVVVPDNHHYRLPA